MKASENPFRSRCIEALTFRLNGTDWDTLLKQLDALNFRVSIVGPHGSGKTTLLRELSSRLIDDGFNVIEITLRDEYPLAKQTFYNETLTKLSVKQILILDGAEFLSYWSWKRLSISTRNLAGLIVTCHDNPRLPVLYRCVPSCELFIALSQRLLGNQNAIADSELETIYSSTGGNIRVAFWCLYDRFAQLC